jgi:hypothetical protein
MSVRKKRVEWSVTSRAGPTGFLSGTLFSLGVSHLKAALSDREQTTYRSATNHYTDQALSCIVMMTAGIEVLVNALVWMDIPTPQIAGCGLEDLELRNALTNETVESKYQRTHEQRKPIPPDCVTLFHIRDEILHGIPVMRDPSTVPKWFRSLVRRGLFLDQSELPKGAGLWLWQQKFCSYELAYWACGAAEAAVSGLAEGNDNVFREKARHDLKLLLRYKAIFPPGKFPQP